MKPKFFKTPLEFRKWLEQNHKKETELVVGFYKVGSGKPSITWPQSVDEALCVGWIDGVRKSIDEESYSIRFTPRKSNSIWSAINIAKVEELKKQGRMKEVGLAAYEKKETHRTKIYSHENEPAKLSPSYEKIFKANKQAYDYFNTQSPSYKKVCFHWIMSAKQEATQVRRLEKLILISEALKKLIF
jgi:uncharacterized protein YdeI (YjbR/CyaY-like superfamily)